MLAPFGNSELQGPSQDRRTGIYVKRETRKSRRLGDLCLSVVYGVASSEKGTWSGKQSCMGGKVKTDQQENGASPWETRAGVCCNLLTYRSSSG